MTELTNKGIKAQIKNGNRKGVGKKNLIQSAARKGRHMAGGKSRKNVISSRHEKCGKVA